MCGVCGVCGCGEVMESAQKGEKEIIILSLPARKRAERPRQLPCDSFWRGVGEVGGGGGGGGGDYELVLHNGNGKDAQSGSFRGDDARSLKTLSRNRYARFKNNLELSGAEFAF